LKLHRAGYYSKKQEEELVILVWECRTLFTIEENLAHKNLAD
jgi:hypothetical protein